MCALLISKLGVYYTLVGRTIDWCCMSCGLRDIWPVDNLIDELCGVSNFFFFSFGLTVWAIGVCIWPLLICKLHSITCYSFQVLFWGQDASWECGPTMYQLPTSFCTKPQSLCEKKKDALVLKLHVRSILQTCNSIKVGHWRLGRRP